MPFFARSSELYVTADLAGGHLMRLDLTALGLRSGSADLIVAIHVLEHVTDDNTALHEVARVLAPGGTAVIAVPTVADTTIEYSAPNPKEHGHVRAPGVDWYDRLHAHFKDVRVLSSDDLPAEYQTYVYEDRTRFPNALAPERPGQSGSCHPDFVAFARV